MIEMSNKYELRLLKEGWPPGRFGEGQEKAEPRNPGSGRSTQVGVRPSVAR
jgi:hypothetical protein